MTSTETPNVAPYKLSKIMELMFWKTIDSSLSQACYNNKNGEWWNSRAAINIKYSIIQSGF